MCFYHDYDWCPEVHGDERKPNGGKARCIECRQAIHPWEPRREIYQQQYEECRQDDCKHVGPCDFGETFEASICEPCCHILGTIQHVEADRGCRPRESRPAFGELADAIHEEPEYLDAAIASRPAIANHAWRFCDYEDFEERLYEEHDWCDYDTAPVDEFHDLGGEG